MKLGCDVSIGEGCAKVGNVKVFGAVVFRNITGSCGVGEINTELLPGSRGIAMVSLSCCISGAMVDVKVFSCMLEDIDVLCKLVLMLRSLTALKICDDWDAEMELGKVTDVVAFDLGCEAF